MKLLITAVGQRTEHWTDLFAVLAEQPELEITLLLADVSPLTTKALHDWTAESSRHRFHLLPHLLSEARSGHMASIVVSPRSLRRLPIERPDVMHVIGEPAYLSTSQFISLRNRRFADVPITHYAAQNVVTRFPVPFPQLERRAYRRVQHLLPITPAALSVLRTKGYAGPATIVPLGVDTARFRPIADYQLSAQPGTDGRFTAGFVGRLEPHKGIADLLDAAERADVDLLIVGQGSLADDVRAAALRRPGRVTLVDWTDHDELPNLIARMDVLVLPAAEVVQRNVLPWVGIPLREQFGRVLVEAMACGVAVVGSDVGEIAHVIGPAGLVYPSGDVAALADRLARLKADPDLTRLLGRLGVERVGAEFGWQQVARALRQIWDDLCARGEREGVSRG